MALIKRLFFLVCFSWTFLSRAQDTFSILAFDSLTREVGAAGASCVNLFSFPGYANDFICELFPDTGAIACQASYIVLNQNNARARMRAGDTPTALINWLIANDAGGTPSVRQYGVVRMQNNSARADAFTGAGCINYKNHIVGPNYTIHGNILLGQQILDSMEARFLREPGDLACKLMAAMQGANVIGADTRCASNNSSSLFAFLKVSQPGDAFGSPSLLVSLKTQNGAMIEPIDSLQKMFTAIHSCTIKTTGLSRLNKNAGLRIFPNPAAGNFTIVFPRAIENGELKISDSQGRLIFSEFFKGDKFIFQKRLEPGVYFIDAFYDGESGKRKLILE